MDSILTYAQENSSSASGSSGIWYVLMAVGLWKMFEKAGEPGWIGFVPFYNEYMLCEKVMNDPWYWLRKLLVVIPIVGWLLYFYYMYQIGKATAKAYGQPESWAWGYTFLPPVFYMITGFSSQYSYYGPYGEGDNRTGEARQARTVDFDVVRQEPVVEKAEPVVEKVTPAPAKEESEVEFDFNQDIIE